MKKFFSFSILLFSFLAFSQNQTWYGTKSLGSTFRINNVSNNQLNQKSLGLSPTGQLQYFDSQYDMKMLVGSNPPSGNSILENWRTQNNNKKLFYFNENDFKFYFFENGSSDWIPLGLQDAPMDSQNYVRNNGSWVVASSSGGSQNLQSVISNGNTVSTSSLASNSYFDFSTSGTINSQRLKAGYDGFFVGEGYNGSSLPFLKLYNASITYGNGFNAIIMSPQLPTDGTQKIINTPPNSGSLALISSGVSIPTSSTSTGVKGQIVYDSSYIYICVATNTWIRSSIQNSF